MEYTPLTDNEDGWRAAIAEGENWQLAQGEHGITLSQASISRPAEVVIPVPCPYVLTAGELDVSLTAGGDI